jgi:hypothetical protein
MRLKENILSKRTDWNYEEVLDDLRRVPGNARVLWKGWGSPPAVFVGVDQSYHGGGRIVKVNNDRGEKEFRGATLGAKTIPIVLQKLGLDTPPVFTTRSYPQAIFFGNPYIFVPSSSYTTCYNPDIFDLIQIKDPEKIEAARENYVFFKNKMPPNDADGEVIVSARRYWLVSVGSLIADTKGKLKTFTKTENVKTYSDASEVIINYLKFRKWVVFQDLQAAQNPENRIKEFEKFNYPTEWIKDWKKRLKIG